MALERLPRNMVIAYAVPYIGLSWFQMSFTSYFYKYTVDELLIPASTIAVILSITRLWDAFSDPFVGFLSDRTGSSAGRRRPWLLASPIPVGVVTWCMWNPPGSLDGTTALLVWMVLAVTLWEVAMTCFFVPYMALGAEITMEQNDRTRVAGFRHIAGGMSQLLMIGCVYLLTHASDARATASWVFLAGGVLSASAMIGGIARVRERPEHRQLGARRFFASLRAALRNPHLVRLVAVYFFDIAGVAAIGLLGPFMAQYVVGQKGLVPFLIFTQAAASYVSTPFAVFLSGRFGKRQVWMTLLGLQIMGFVLAGFTGPGETFYLVGCIALVGLGSTGGHVVGMSLLADTADYDEYHTGERREGIYYSAINIARKVMFSALTAIVGFAMQHVIGFEPNAEQTPETLLGLRTLFAIVPTSAFLVAIALLMRFRLTAAQHRDISRQLDARRRA